MVDLAKRIIDIGTNQPEAHAAFHPAGNGNVPMVMPLAAVTYYPDPAYPYTGALAYEDLHPVWSADQGGIVAAHDTGWWGKVVPAGSLSPAHR